tara:strand:- start:278 stop:469 length:192 start_codon:yes stop_codon:yes gene_type:complete
MISAAAELYFIQVILAGYVPLVVVLEVEVEGVEMVTVITMPLVVTAVMELSSFNTCLGNRRKL